MRTNASIPAPFVSHSPAVYMISLVGRGLLQYSCGQMSTQNVQAFFAKVANTPELNEKLKAAATLEEIVTLAKTEGFSIEPDELTAITSQLSDEALEGVSGGRNESMAGMSIESIIMHVMMERSKLMAEKVREQANQVQAMNEKLR